MCIAPNDNNDNNMVYGVLDNEGFNPQEGDQVFFLAHGEQIEIRANDDDSDSEYEEVSDYENEESEEEEEEEDDENEESDDDDDDDEYDEQEEIHQFYRREAAEWEAENRESDTEELDFTLPPPAITRQATVNVSMLGPVRREGEMLGPLTLRRETTSDYLTPNHLFSRVSTPTAPRANRRPLRDITNLSNIRPRRLHFN